MVSKSKILFDGNCIVCDREVSYYSRIAPDMFEMMDISDVNFSPEKFGLTKDQVMKHMHVISTEGIVYKGVDAFSFIWSQIPRFQFASKFIKFPGVYSVSKILYEVFARNRHFLPKKST